MRYTQPQAGARIDWSNPIAKGLVLACVPVQSKRPVNLVTNEFATEQACHPADSGGMGATFSAAIGNCTFKPRTAIKSFCCMGMIPADTADDHMLLSITNSQQTASWLGACLIRNYGSPVFGVSSCVSGNFYGFYGPSYQFGSVFCFATNSNFEGANRGNYLYSGGNPYRSGLGDTITLGHSLDINGSSRILTGWAGVFLAWSRDLSKEELISISNNPWQIFKGTPNVALLKAIVGGQPQLLAPTSDISTGNWASSLGGSLFAAIDESTASDADYITASTPTSCETKLATATDPLSSAGHILRYRLLAGSGNVAVALKQGATTIAAWGPHALTGAAQDFAQTLSGAQADSITDYTDLRVAFTSS